jgi:hypothetical protein
MPEAAFFVPQKPSLPGVAAQSGSALAIALIALAAMALAAVCLVRTANANIQLASNLAFRQGAVWEADMMAEQARNWLVEKHAEGSSALDADLPDDGYYASLPEDGTPCNGLDYTGFCQGKDPVEIRWQERGGHARTGTATPACATVAKTGDQGCYVVERLCEEAGPIEAGKCRLRLAPGKPEDPASCAEGRDCGGAAGFALPTADSRQQAIYRITVRIAGPRSNAAYTQTFLLL